jgi:hypothetical protein
VIQVSLAGLHVAPAHASTAPHAGPVAQSAPPHAQNAPPSAPAAVQNPAASEDVRLPTSLVHPPALPVGFTAAVPLQPSHLHK